MKRALSIAAVSAACVVGAWSHSAHAQATNSGDIRGIVTDSTGAVVPGVTVTVTNTATGVSKTLHTNKAGLYDTNSIVVGTYDISFEGQGFQKFDRTGISLQVGLSTVNATLKVGSTSDTVTVNTDLPLLDADTGTQKTTLEAKDMQVLPNVGQNWENFAITLPGSAGAQGSNNPGQVISANGNLPYNNIVGRRVSFID